MEFDFDAWARLAKDDPAEFERRRELALRAAIDAAPPDFRQRLEQLQNRLDRDRQRAPTPLASRVRMNSLLWAGFYRLRKELSAAASGTPPVRPVTKQSAKVIPLRSARGERLRNRATPA
jgi:hypothetical protein